MNKLSVVIMNWARPEKAKRFITQYARNPRIGEVIAWDPSIEHPLLSSESYHLPEGDHVHFIRSSFDFGLYPRFALGSLVNHEGVLIVDDDIELPEDTITSLHEHYLAEPQRIHGIFGRRPAPDGTYSTGMHQFGACEVVLTRAMVISPWLCGLATAWGSRHVREIPGEPRGNGEDILASYVAMAQSRQLNAAYNLPFKNHDSAGPEAISVRFKGHNDHRTAMVRWCRKNILKTA